MAQAPTPLQARTIVDDFKATVLQLITEAAAYVAGGVHIEETESNIRQLRILTQALNSALSATGGTGPIIPPPQPGVPASVAAARAAGKS